MVTKKNVVTSTFLNFSPQIDTTLFFFSQHKNKKMSAGRHATRIREETTEARIETEKEISPGTWLTSVTQIREVVKENVPPWIFYLIFFYFLCTILAFGAFVYQSGKHQLLVFRSSTKTRKDVEPIEELTVVMGALQEWKNFYEAVYWPYFIWKQLIPSFILWMNPRQPPQPNVMLKTEW